MTTVLRPGVPLDAMTLPIVLERLDASDTVSGTPRAGAAALVEGPGAEVGVWEMTAGTARDTEVDEVFVVLSGRAWIRFLEVPGGSSPADAEIGAGSVVRLTAGMRTEWTVAETLRKVYVALG
ncbi:MULTISPECIES: cupin domain-containing protein [Bacteria]|uniref:cupin domain-containing protein n=1 Tax=Bacteria TaxID=2 RepID=UPI003C799801